MSQVYVCLSFRMTIKTEALLVKVSSFLIRTVWTEQVSELVCEYMYSSRKEQSGVVAEQSIDDANGERLPRVRV